MEIELKYRIPMPAVADDIWKDNLFCSREEEGSREEIFFNARYFDTPDFDLARNDMAYRVRKEGCAWVAALKWKGHTEGALHMREELNVSVDDDKPDPEVFCESEIGAELMRVIGEKQLESMLETRFQRRRFRIDTGTGIFELSVDQGLIVTPYGEEPISEVEIELFSGETEELQNLGEMLQNKYGLEKEERSKYARGIDIIRAGR
jgi:triphosphatase